MVSYDALFPGASSIAFIKWYSGGSRKNLEDRRFVDPMTGRLPSDDPSITSGDPDKYPEGEHQEFIRRSGWPDNWERTDSPLLWRRMNPDGSYEYTRGYPEDLFGVSGKQGAEMEQVLGNPIDWHVRRYGRNSKW